MLVTFTIDWPTRLQQFFCKSILCSFRRFICSPTGCKTSHENCRSTFLGCVAPNIVFSGCDSSISPFVLHHVEHCLLSAVQLLWRNQKLDWLLDYFRNNQAYSLSLAALQMDNWCSFLNTHTLNKSYFHFEKCFFFTRKKCGVIFIHLIIMKYNFSTEVFFLVFSV